MFQNLKQNRSLIMGLAILWVAFYHIPWVDQVTWLDFIHDIGYIGVDIFLFLSGMGVCHSVRNRGREGYLVQRAIRILPGLLPVALVWSLIMLCLNVMNLEEFFGSVTLLGWWFGQSKQLNWYFSAVWMFYLLGAGLYKPVVEGKHPILVVLFVSWLSSLAMLLSPYHYHAECFTRVPVFLAGMLLGRMELRGNANEKLLRCILYSLIPIGLLLIFMTWSSWGQNWGTYYGLWWYPFLLVVPGGVFLAADIAHWLRKRRIISSILRPLEVLGDSSSEALMLHVGIYKLIQLYTGLLPMQWIAVMLLCLLLGVIYRNLVVKRLPVRTQ